MADSLHRTKGFDITTVARSNRLHGRRSGNDPIGPTRPAGPAARGRRSTTDVRRTRNVAFKDVSVVPMDRNDVLDHQTVLVVDGWIVSVEPTGQARVPNGTELIAGQGRYLMPGLADMHMHLWMRDSDPGQLVLYLAQGTTTVRSLSGAPENRAWRHQVEAGELLGPTILSADKIIIGGLDDFDPELRATMPIEQPQTTDEAVAIARQQAGGWADFIKVYDGLTTEQYFAAVAAGRGAGAYVVAHALDEAPLADILTSGVNEIAHLDELNFYHWIGFPDEPDFALDYDAIPTTAALMRDNGVNVVSNLVTDETMIGLLFDADEVFSRPEYAIVRPETLNVWRTEGRHLDKFVGQGPYRRDLELPFFKALLQGLHRAGVVVTVGTDTSSLVEASVPSQIHRELELLVEAGFTEYEALAAGTKNAATIVQGMGGDCRFGTVAVGQRGDLILLNANPLDDVGNTRTPVGVVARGIWHPRTELDRMVADFVATY